jgi:LysM repeat protein
MRLRQTTVSVAVVAILLFCATPAMASGLGSDSVQGQTVHTVQPGENLFRIALRYGTTIEAIRSANGLSSNVIRTGQRLVIPRGGAASPSSSPSGSSASGAYVVQRGDTLFSIAMRHGVTTSALMQANNLGGSKIIYAGQRLIIPRGGSGAAQPAATRSYTVRPGDTLSSIARRFGTTVAVLAHVNGLANPSAIRPGQVLRLSGSAAAPAPSGGGKQVVIDLSEQRLYAYQGGQLVFNFIASSGRAPSRTRPGNYRVQSKIPKAYGSTWNIWMPYWLGIYWAGRYENGIHALPILSNGRTLWAGFLGQPISFGCIVLGTSDAQRLYSWAEIGTPVSIRY